MLLGCTAKVIADTACGRCGYAIRALLATGTARAAAARVAVLDMSPSTGHTHIPVTATAETPGSVAKIRWLRPVDGTQVMQILRAGPLVPALVGGEQGLTEPWSAAALALVPGFDLLNDVCERRTRREPVGPDPGRAEDGLTLVMDGRRDRCDRSARHQAPGSQPARNARFFLRVAFLRVARPGGGSGHARPGRRRRMACPSRVP